MNNWPAASGQASWPTSQLIAPAHIIEQLQNEKLPLDKDGLLLLWQRSQRKLAAIKENEMELRKLCTAILVATLPEKKDGVNTVELGNGYEAKVTLKINYKLEGTNDQIEAVLDTIETCGNEGKFLSERLVNWKATLSVAEYKLLVEDAKSSPISKQVLDLLNKIVVTDDGAPTLTIKEPKK